MEVEGRGADTRNSRILQVEALLFPVPQSSIPHAALSVRPSVLHLAPPALLNAAAATPPSALHPPSAAGKLIGKLAEKHVQNLVQLKLLPNWNILKFQVRNAD